MPRYRYDVCPARDRRKAQTDRRDGVRFTDGTRAFFAGHAGTGIMNPQLGGGTKTVEASEIVTKREYADMLAAKERAAVRRKADAERAERREYERLVEKFGKQAE